MGGRREGEGRKHNANNNGATVFWGHPPWHAYVATRKVPYCPSSWHSRKTLTAASRMSSHKRMTQLPRYSCSFLGFFLSHFAQPGNRVLVISLNFLGSLTSRSLPTWLTPTNQPVFTLDSQSHCSSLYFYETSVVASTYKWEHIAFAVHYLPLLSSAPSRSTHDTAKYRIFLLLFFLSEDQGALLQHIWTLICSVGTRCSQVLITMKFIH